MRHTRARKFSALLLAVCLLVGALPMAASADGAASTEGYAKFTLNAPLTGNFLPPNNGVGITALSDVPIGSFTAPEAGIYLFRNHNNARDMRSLGDLSKSHFDQASVIGTGENLGETDTGFTALIYGTYDCVDMFAALVLNKNETVLISQTIGLQDGHSFDELDDLSFTATVTKAADDHIKTAVLDTPIQQPAGTSCFDPNSYYFYKFTAPEDGVYKAVCSDTEANVMYSGLDWDENGTRHYGGYYEYFRKSGMIHYFAMYTPSGGTFTIKNLSPLVAMRVDTVYQLADISCIDECVAGMEFVPEASGKYTFTANPLKQYQSLDILDETGYRAVGRLANNSLQDKSATLSLNLEAGKKYHVLVGCPVAAFPISSDLTLKVTKNTSSSTGPDQEEPTPDDPPKPTVAGFSDVFEDAYYADAVKWAVENGVTSGTDKTHFSPSASCTRAQAVTFLWRALGKPEPAGTGGSFTDVAADSYYEKAVQWAVEQGVTSGTSETKFSPNASCTRAQIVTFLYRAAGSPATAGTGSFQDVKAGDYYENAVNWAVANDITTGTSKTAFSPGKDCIRGQIVTFLYRHQTK